jgi:hypothetical protein
VEVSTLCSLTALQKLDILSARGYTSWQADTILAPLSALQRLTSLQLDYVRRRQLEHLRVPLLLELAVRLERQEQRDAVQLQMGHLTSLTKLAMSDWAGSMQLEDTLPPGLQELEFKVVDGPRDVMNACSFQPLLRLQQLRKLQLQFRGVPYASEVQQLSRLASLQELRATYGWTRNEAIQSDEVADTLSAFTGLPLKSLSWTSIDIPIAVVEQIGHLQGLTRLELGTHLRGARTGLEATPRQLATFLRPLIKLRRLQLHVHSRAYDAVVASIGSRPCSSSGGDATTVGRSAAVFDDAESVAALLRCVGWLRMVEEVELSLLVRLTGSDVQLLQGMLQQLLPSCMLPYCKVQADRISIQL